MRDDDGGVYPEQPATIQHGYLFRPERIRLIDHPHMQWWIEKVLDEEDGSPDSPVYKAYRFQVIGPVPGTSEKTGTFVMIAVSYHERRHWWVWPEDVGPAGG